MRALIALAATALTLAAQPPPGPEIVFRPGDTPGKIEGKVLHSVTRAPVARVNITLIPASTDAAPTRAFATTDADGSFAFPSVQPGLYTLEAARNGFLTIRYGAQTAKAAPAVVHVDAGQNVTLQFALVPQGVLAVEVFNEQGEPLQNATVQVFARRFLNGRQQPVVVDQGRTNDLGIYRAASLPGGSYYISATPPAGPQPEPSRTQGQTADRAPGPTFFPAANDFAGAVAVDLTSGAERPISITIEPGASYRIRGRLPMEVLTAAGATLVLSPQEATPTASNPRAQVAPDGTFELAGVLPGSYVIGYLGSLNGLPPRLLARADVTVTESDAEGVLLSPVELLTLKGRIRMEDANAGPIRFNGSTLTLVPMEVFPGTPPQRIVPLAGDGTFTVDNLPQGRYRMLPNGSIEGAYLAAIRSGDVDVTNQPLDFTNTVAPPTLEFVYRPGAITLEVLVNRPLDQPPGTVIVVPDPYRPQRIPLPVPDAVILTPDPAGLAVARNLAPGTYRAYAFELFEPADGIDPAVLQGFEGRSARIELQPGQGGRVAVDRIPAFSPGVYN